MKSPPTTDLQVCFDRPRAGDEPARIDLIDAICERLRQLARALTAAAPAMRRDFFHRAALQIRRELIALSRSRFGPEGLGANHAADDRNAAGQRAGPPADECAGDSLESGKLAVRGEMHGRVSTLAEDERETFNFNWCQRLKHIEGRALLGVSTRTIQRRWNAASLAVHGALDGDLPRS